MRELLIALMKTAIDITIIMKGIEIVKNKDFKVRQKEGNYVNYSTTEEAVDAFLLAQDIL